MQMHPDITASMRHARLFELIRQRNVAQEVGDRPRTSLSGDPLDVQLFRMEAERSLAPLRRLQG